MFFIRDIGIAACFAALSLSSAASGETGAGDSRKSPAAPLLTVGRFAVPPAIDGELTDPAWAGAIPADGFVTFGSQLPTADTSTSVRMGYDKTYLYVSAVCQEPLLDARTQRQHEIKANAKERDGKLFGDHALMIALRPPGSAESYEYVINTKGVISDARASVDSLWSSRDLGWNAAVDSQVRVLDGKWQVELRIPWAAMQAAAPANEKWGVLLTRLGANAEERSSWHPTSSAGIHDPLAWGELSFEESVTAFQAAPLSRLERGENALQIQMKEGKDQGALLFTTRLYRGGEERQIARAQSTLKKSGTVPLHVKDRGQVRLQWTASDPVTLKDIYRSPESVHKVELMQVSFLLSTESPYRVYVNGKQVYQGERAADTPIALGLGNGVNLVAIEAESGKMVLKDRSANLLGIPVNWKVAPAGKKTEDLLTSDEHSWETAASTSEGDTAIVGSGEKAAVFRHTFLINHFCLWPQHDPALHIPEGASQGVLLSTEGIPGRTLSGWTAHFEMPENIQITGATGFYRTMLNLKEEPWIGNESKPLYQFSSPDNGQTATVKADKEIKQRPDWVAKAKVVEFYLTAKGQLRGPATEREMRYWITANDATLTQLPVAYPLQVIAPLKGKQPKKLAVELWGAPRQIADNIGEGDAALYETFQKAGVNYVIRGRMQSHRLKPELGLKEVAMMRLRKGNVDMSPYLKEHPEARRVTDKGTRKDGEFCTTALLEEKPWPAIGEALLKRLGDEAPARILYDYEFSPFTGPHSCYCERCLQQFASDHGIPPDSFADLSVIQKNYREEWKVFMAKRGADVLEKLKNCVHQHCKGVEFGIYSGYQIPQTQELYGIDWKLVGEKKAVDYGSGGYGRPVPGLADTIEALQGIPFHAGVLLYPYLHKEVKPNVSVQQISKATFLRSFIDSTGGILIYELGGMDGRSFYALAETTRLVAEHEELFLKGERTAVAEADPVEVALLQHDKNSLLALMNSRRSPQRYRFTIPSHLGEGKSFYTDETIAPGGEVDLTLNAGEVAVFTFLNH